MSAIARPSGTTTNVAFVALLASLGASAGIHAGLFAAHVSERTALAFAFLAASAACLGATAAVASRAGRPARLAAASVFASLLVAYVVFRHEPLDAVAAISKAVETAGLALALGAHGPDRPVGAGTPIGIVTLAFAAGLFLAGGHGH